jgi:phosphohistidine swiveling domain-containing protein
LLKPLLRSANVQSNDREAARSALVAYSEPGRRTMPAIGARWVERGWLADPNDIFFLLGEEIVDALEGKLDGTGLAARVEDRRIQFDAWMTETPADVILEDAGKVFIPEAAKESIRMEGQDCFIGVAVGSGCATGKARLLRSPEEGVRLGNGDILVVPSTDPAWTPLFLRAGGLVMETGGYLSHGAIVAREFGIPAVVNLPGILHHLQDGDVVEVDGGRGLVRRLRQ